MLVGYPPFFDDVHDNPLNIYTKILAGKVLAPIPTRGVHTTTLTPPHPHQIKFPVHIDQYAKDLIKRLLIPNPAERLGDLSVSSSRRWRCAPPVLQGGVERNT
jgi:serine/threonine protein kinase